MLNKMLFVCLFVALFSAGSSLSCRWMNDKFQQHSEESMALLDHMTNNSTNTTEDAELDASLAFPYSLYNQASNASDEDKLAFTVHVLREVCGLFEEDYSAASWEESTVEDFLIVLNRQADELSSCMGSHGRKKKSPKLQMYFKRLSHQIVGLLTCFHSAEAWELIRTEIQRHLQRADLVHHTHTHIHTNTHTPNLCP
uniref:Interferon a3-like n=1 Tax=Salarias fasciatus TaxID=181472 RepID=A0A672GYD0_SALFA